MLHYIAAVENEAMGEVDISTTRVKAQGSLGITMVETDHSHTDRT